MNGTENNKNFTDMKRMTKCSLTLALAASSLTLAAQKPVSDKDKQNQLASMEYMQWNFTPASYYYSWYWKRINLGLFSIWVKMPGQGWHDKGPAGLIPALGDNYVNEQWRQMTPLRATSTAEAAVAKPIRGDTQELWTRTREDDALEIADNELDIAYGSANEKISSGQKALAGMAVYLTPDEINETEEELQAIKQAVSMIHDSKTGNAKKAIGYDEQLKVMDELKKKTLARAKFNYCMDIMKGKETIWK